MLFWFLSSLLIPNSCSSVFTLLNFCSKTVTQNILKCCGFSVYNLETSPFHFLHRSTLFLRRHLQTSLSVETPVSLHPSVRPSLQQTRRPSKPIIDGDLPSPWTLLSHPQHSSSLSSSWHKGLMTKELKEWPKHKEHTLIWVMTKAAGNELSPTVHKHKGSLREFLQKKEMKPLWTRITNTLSSSLPVLILSTSYFVILLSPMIMCLFYVHFISFKCTA